jgi:ectoine hydroxylase-related dioxygenase (phytanoyl-CoA dioxygenase family)
MQATSEQGKEYQENGVVLLKDCIDEKLIDKVRDKWMDLDLRITTHISPNEKPRIALWRHVSGEEQRFCDFDDYPEAWELIEKNIAPVIRNHFASDDGTKLRLQLLETIVFNKPPEIGKFLSWHQDASYYPITPNVQIATWIPFEPVIKDSGALVYALKTHKGELRATVDLYKNTPFENETRELIPVDPAEHGYELACMEMDQKDMILHDGYVWHYSGPNVTKDRQRRGLSVRFIVDEAIFSPRPNSTGEEKAFDAQISIKPGDLFQGKPFPLV